MGLRIVPLTLRQANALVSELHRHHKPARGHRFSLGTRSGEGPLVGAAIVGRPVARAYDPYLTAEVTRLVTDGTKNACSILYAACARAAREMGFRIIQTYILDTETGTSLVAAGWTCMGETRGDTWTRAARSNRRVDQPQCKKLRWEKVLNG